MRSAGRLSRANSRSRNGGNLIVIPRSPRPIFSRRARLSVCNHDSESSPGLRIRFSSQQISPAAAPSRTQALFFLTFTSRLRLGGTLSPKRHGVPFLRLESTPHGRDATFFRKKMLKRLTNCTEELYHLIRARSRRSRATASRNVSMLTFSGRIKTTSRYYKRRSPGTLAYGLPVRVGRGCNYSIERHDHRAGTGNAAVRCPGG
jgi:hypothetical protein